MIDNTALVKSSHFNTISFHVVIGNILTLGVRAPGSNPGESIQSWAAGNRFGGINYSNKNRNLASTTKFAFVV